VRSDTFGRISEPEELQAASVGENDSAAAIQSITPRIRLVPLREVRRDNQASIEGDTDPTRLSPDNVTMVIAVLCVDNQVE